MKKIKDQFLCSLPWAHISMQASGRLRLCCHDELATAGQGESIRALKSPSERHHLGLYRSTQSLMDSGKVPAHCQSCARLERAGGSSPRHEYNQKFSRSGKLEYLDITLDNHCNLKCRMCTPKYSKKIAEDWRHLGIPLGQEDELALQKESAGEWLRSEEAAGFWEESLKELRLITFTGGEPFLSPFLEDIIRIITKSDRLKEIELRFYSNTTLFPKELLDKLKSFKRVTLFCSLDGIEETSDYIRFPSKWTHIKNVLGKLVKYSQEVPNIEVRIHSVIQAYNSKNLIDLFEYLLQYKKELPFIPALTAIESPKIFRLHNLPLEYLERVKDSLDQFVLRRRDDIDEFHKDANREQLQNFYSALDDAMANNVSSERYIELIALTKRFDQLRNQRFKKFD